MKFASISDFRPRAQRRLPKFAFDYLDGGAGTEAGIRRNLQAFDDLQLKPRMLVNIEHRDLATTFFGRKWAAPFGTAPIGMGNLLWPRAEEAIARACVAAGIPYTLSTPATTSLERMAEIAGANGWFQLYVGRSEEMVADLVVRAERAGYDVMLVTVDVPVPPRRLRDIKNEFTMKFRFTPRVIYELVTHPLWSLQTLMAGMPKSVNMERYAPATGALPVARYMSSQVTGRFDWNNLKQLRERWRRKLVVKGLLTAEDALRARDLGCDGVVVSNHGGRQLASLPATIDVLPEIRAAVGPSFPLILDSGIRSGEHIVKALAAGADFVLIGRAMMYAVAALGRAGPKVAIELLTAEMMNCLGQIGYTDIASLKAAAPVLRRR
ncbi:MAG: alpha-hydroxy acid oxidase [Xanthobacteraceae bacterium]|nr:alpha-hydroxy acid oxidase [Xanthobacteraceae bacterium]